VKKGAVSEEKEGSMLEMLTVIWESSIS